MTNFQFIFERINVMRFINFILIFSQNIYLNTEDKCKTAKYLIFAFDTKTKWHMEYKLEFSFRITDNSSPAAEVLETSTKRKIESLAVQTRNKTDVAILER